MTMNKRSIMRGLKGKSKLVYSCRSWVVKFMTVIEECLNNIRKWKSDATCTIPTLQTI